MYSKTVLDHFQNPRNLTEMRNPDAVGMGASQVCGDVMTLFLSIAEGRVKDASFKTMGCGAAIASGSILTEILKGKTLAEAESISKDSLVNALGGLPAIKMHCPELALEALRMAFADFHRRNESAKN
jgi:nitrogen fixation NifU-like protein